MEIAHDHEETAYAFELILLYYCYVLNDLVLVIFYSTVNVQFLDQEKSSHTRSTLLVQ